MPKIEFENNDGITPALVVDNDTIQYEIVVDGNDSNLVKWSVQSTGGATGGNPMITLDSSANGNVTFSPNGSGTVVVDTFTEGFVISDASGNLSIGSAGTMSWEVVTDATDDLVAAHGYFANRAGGVTFTLPATAAVGDTFEVAAMHADGFSIAQNAGQTIQIGSSATTTGAGGSLASTAIGDWVRIVCNVANTDFMAHAQQGNITVV